MIVRLSRDGMGEGRMSSTGATPGGWYDPLGIYRGYHLQVLDGAESEALLEVQAQM